jgi:hypothetical protein
VEYGRGTAVE